MAFLTVVNNEKTIGKTINAGSNSEISIHNLFLMIKNIMNSNATYINTSDRMRPVNSEVQRLYSDSNLLKNITGFEQQVNLEKGLIETIKWFSYKDNLKKYKADLYNV
jgi:nucleoside-diphosphate-sugar epimerase